MAVGELHFEGFVLDAARYQLRAGADPVRIEPRAFDLLRVLIEQRDRVVTKPEILETVWGTTYVSDAALTTALRTVRRAIGDTGAAQRLIRTVHGRGYQFVGDVTVADAAAGSAPVPPPAPVGPASFAPAGRAPAPTTPVATSHTVVGTQAIRYCAAADGSRIAYATVGEGPVLVKAANWITHLDLEWDSPVWAHWNRGMAWGRRLIRYDERGCGMSDWDPPSNTFEDWVADLEAVVEASGVETFPLLGISQGAAVAVAYAARHPDRVERLVLSGGYARGRIVRAEDDAQRAAAALDVDLARVGWEQQDSSFMRVFASQFLPEGTLEDWDAFTEFQRSTTSAANAVNFLEEFAHIDVVDEAPRVTCPTLILHSRGDVRVPVSQARELATLIPDSSLVLLESANHLLGEDEPAWKDFLSHLDAFLGSADGVSEEI
ncbi:alpha/beta fold hydrolase [Demequina sp. NBRC 110055]|uniref:alpha/beta fold hydrolase n=1 Tax=Demequina sp. NBRC 110055 TaxID=1570344 RepID=UPI0009FFEAF4|nr:alpha/beta fold hydrolase [Demequina sp. NBRC 110055]